MIAKKTSALLALFDMAYRMARNAGLDADTSHAVASAYMAIHDEQFTPRERREFIQFEIQRHAQL